MGLSVVVIVAVCVSYARLFSFAYSKFPWSLHRAFCHGYRYLQCRWWPQSACDAGTCVLLRAVFVCFLFPGPKVVHRSEIRCVFRCRLGWHLVGGWLHQSDATTCLGMHTQWQQRKEH